MKGELYSFTLSVVQVLLQDISLIILITLFFHMGCIDPNLPIIMVNHDTKLAYYFTQQMEKHTPSLFNHPFFLLIKTKDVAKPP